MKSHSNRLCRSIVNNPGSEAPISYFELITMREYDSDKGTEIREIRTATEFLDTTNVYDEPFYRIYGVYKNKSPKQFLFIRDFFDIDKAKQFLSDITGESVIIISY